MNKQEQHKNRIEIGDKVKFHCFDGGTIIVEVTEINDGLIYGKSQFGTHWANPENVELVKE